MLKKVGQDTKEPESEIKASGNEMLFTPSLKNLAATTDGSKALKQEVFDSNLRLKAVRHGMRIVDVAPPHKEDYYIPNKKNYQPPHRPGDSKAKLSKSATRHGRNATHSVNFMINESTVSPKSGHFTHSFRQNITDSVTPLAHSLLTPGSIKQTGGNSFFMTDVKSGYSSTHAETNSKIHSILPMSAHNRGVSLELGTTMSSMDNSKTTMTPNESSRPRGLRSILEPLVLSGRLSLKKHQKVMRSIEQNTLPELENSSLHSRNPLRSKEVKRIGELKEKFLSEDKVKVLPTEWLPGEGEEDMKFSYA